jgi:peroxiredoxin
VVGTTAVDFQLVDLNGHPQHLNDYRGKVVLLNFWATWCKPCTTEMPAMQKAYDRLREKGFVVLAIKELEDDEEVRKHINQYGHTFPVADGPRQRSIRVYVPARDGAVVLISGERTFPSG